MIASIIVVSDTAAADNSTDKASAALQECLQNSKFEYGETIYVHDDVAEIQQAVRNAKAAQDGGLVLCTGGTGFALRDVTPEAVEPLLERHAPGIVHAMFAKSVSITPFACMSRAVAGIYGRAMVLTLPGKPKGAVENLEAVVQVLPHGVKLLQGDNSRRLHEKMDRHGQNHYERDATSTHTHTHSHHEHDHSHNHGLGHDHSHTHSHAHAHQGPKFHQLEGKLSNDLSAPVSKRARESPYPMISMDEADSLIAKNTPAAKTTTMSILDESIVGMIIAEDVQSAVPVPSFPASIVDGYAVVHSDGPGIYPISTVSHASPDEAKPISGGTIARVTTGAPVPQGATAVVPVEETQIAETDSAGEETKIAVLAKNVQDGDNVRTVGSDVKLGEVVVERGTQVTKNGGVVGLLASVGVLNVKVYAKPVVGVMSTGNELVDISKAGKTLRGGAIWDSNRPSLLSMVRSWGCIPIDLGIAADEPQALEAQLQQATEKCNVVITSGGVSMGELDLLKPTIERSLHGEIKFGRVAMKPGKPTTFATVPNGALVFALPGNPASATVTFHLFVLPALRKLGGVGAQAADPHQPHHYALPRVPVVLDQQVKLDPRPEYHRVTVGFDRASGVLRAVSTGGQRSSRIGSLNGANALLMLPSSDKVGRKTMNKGESVDAVLIEQLDTL